MSKHHRHRRGTKKGKQSRSKQHHIDKKSKHTVKQPSVVKIQESDSTTTSTASWVASMLTDSAATLYESVTKIPELWQTQSAQAQQENDTCFIDTDINDVDVLFEEEVAAEVTSVIAEEKFKKEALVFDEAILGELTSEEKLALEKETAEIVKKVKQESSENVPHLNQTSSVSVADYATAAASFLAASGATVAATATLMLLDSSILATTAVAATAGFAGVYPKKAEQVATSMARYFLRESSEGGVLTKAAFWFVLLNCAARAVDATQGMSRGSYHDVCGSSSHNGAGESYVVFGAMATQSTNPFPSAMPSPTPLPTYQNPFELSNLSGSNGFQINGIAVGDASGYSVSGIGDVNKDGYDDFIIGAPSAGGSCYYGAYDSGAGESYVVFGQSNFSKTLALSELNGSNGFQINAIAYKGFFGGSVSGAGDVNGDGYADLIVGAPDASPSSAQSPVEEQAGQSYVVFGQSNFNKTLALSELNGRNGFQINGIAAGDWSGGSVSGAGDVNNDGYADLIIGAEGASSDGHKGGGSYVIFGQLSFVKTLELSELNGSNGFQINGVAGGGWLGCSVNSAGDINKDGYADLIIGAYGSSPDGRKQAGQSYVVFGQSNFSKILELSDLNGDNGFQINGIAAGDWSGNSVSGIGDMNGDGCPDFAIGASNAREQAGQSYVIFGQSDFSKVLELSELNGSNGFQINGIAAGDFSGHSVSGAGDVNSDGYADLIIGADTASPYDRKQAGQSYVVFGRSNFSKVLELFELNGSNGFQINGIAAGDFSGHSVSSIGDLNGDGCTDLLIGANGASPKLPKDNKHMNIGFIAGVVAGGGLLAAGLVCICYYKKRRASGNEDEITLFVNETDRERNNGNDGDSIVKSERRRLSMLFENENKFCKDKRYQDHEQSDYHRPTPSK